MSKAAILRQGIRSFALIANKRASLTLRCVSSRYSISNLPAVHWRLFSTGFSDDSNFYFSSESIIQTIKNLPKSSESLPETVISALKDNSIVSDFSQSDLSTVTKLLEKENIKNRDDEISVFNSVLVACCDTRDYMDGYRLITSASTKGFLEALSMPACTSIYMMLFKYKQYDKIIHLYELMSSKAISLDNNVQLSVIRSYSNCQRLQDALNLMNSLIKSTQEQLRQATDADTVTRLQNQLFKAYSVGIEANCNNNEGEAALTLLHEMADVTQNAVAIPRSCYLVLFNYFANTELEASVVKEKLKDIADVCDATGCDKKEVFNHYIYALMKTGDIKSAREVALNASHSLGFNGETYTYILMGLNHTLKHRSPQENKEEERAQTLALAMTLLHRYRKTTVPSVNFYLQMIKLLGHFHEYDKLDSLIQFMNKDKIPFDGRIYSALIDAFEDTQLVIDVYNDAKNNLPETDPYASLLFPQNTVSQEYQQFPKVIDCARLKQAACKTIILQELSSMNVSSLESVHDLIFITDYHTPNKKVYNTVTSVLNTLNIFWFQGPHDGRIYVTRDALIDYLTKVDENKHVWGFKKLVIARTKLIPILLLLTYSILSLHH